VKAAMRCATMAAVLVASAACTGASKASSDTSATLAAAITPAGSARGAASGPFGGIGTRATPAAISAWDIDVNASGAGLPPGQGSYARGETVYAEQCASCHGAKGEGIAPNPKLVGREPADFSFANDYKIPKTIGNYWPYATTLYDYINRAMPFATPGSLSPTDVYSVTAFLLVENGVIDKLMTLDARSLPQVHMPARDRFVRDDRLGGPNFR